MADPFALAVLAALGLAIGFVGGLIGLVLGVVRFPLIFGTEASASVAAGTNIGISTLGALTAAVRHMRQNNFHRRVFAVMALTGAAGAFSGSLLTHLVPAQAILLLVGAIVSYEAFSLIKSLRHKSAASPRPNLALESAIGLGVGFLGGLVGLVLGSIRLPAMINALKMEPRVAVGTNLAASAAMGAAGLLGHVINGEVDYEILGVMGATAMAGGFVGAKYTGRFSERTLKLLIGLVLIAVAAVMFWRALYGIS
ncbi:MAG: sulfite exporter TauE/SafE family protein [Nitrososphaera sp.]